MGKAWSGRLPEGTDRRVEQFTESISFDHRLYREDIEGSRAHASMLAHVGIITSEEADQLDKTLVTIRDEIEKGDFTYDISLEDIHMHIERRLIELVGDTGRKLHTARSRNDQVATDLKLWVRKHLDLLDSRLEAVQRAFVTTGFRYKDVIVPAYTHLQRAQPVLVAHALLAYVEKLQRDRDRARDCRARLNTLPLGAAALAGTTLPIDRQFVAEALGFDGVAANSIDVSSDRDFAIETVFVLTMVAEHLSSWAEEWIIWATTEFDVLTLPDAFCTGSSIMPHKKNPDILELIRGKSARVIGDLQSLLVLVKALPLAYNRDLQEDKPPLFDAMETVLACLELAEPLIAETTLNRESIAERLPEGFLDATTLMEQLIKVGVPMRSAHEAVGGLVREAIERQCTLAELDLELFEALAPGKGNDVKSSLGVERALAAFQSEGSTAPERVEKQLRIWGKRLGLELS
ncbi:Argininosuccinate lyase [Planctomycetes bacterium Pan216]|uniref:Argininosuccinate lyase n=1 Tax=Kolteria novifilia TaxID=2527975 RepID=A0A518AYI5_9BACT|nr:Argininosuccinate lyase [Planctomycetes bacterium Pan216]